MYVYVTFPFHFCYILSLVQDLAALIKSCVYVFWCLLVQFDFYTQNRIQKNFYNKNFVREFLINQDKNFHQIVAPF